MEQTVVTDRHERKQKWQGHVEGWRRSGLKVTAYCTANGLNAAQFWYWRRALLPKATEKRGFVELTSSAGGDASITVMVRGVAIPIRDGFSRSLLRQVVDCLSAP